MKSGDRRILIGIAVLGLVAAFWFMVLSPKRDEVAKLDEEITALESSVAEQEQLAAAAELARDDYDDNYKRLVVLGKAVPGDDDAASLIEQTQVLASRAGIDFRGLTVTGGTGAAPAPPPAAESTTDQVEGEAEDGVAGEPTTTAVPATEATAATLPLGATIGPAGLPVVPYEFKLRGNYFQVADFMAGLDRLVSAGVAGVNVDGRLFTIDGFTLEGDEQRGFPYLSATMNVSTYVAPADQGVTAGATPTAPPPAVATPTTTATP